MKKSIINAAKAAGRFVKRNTRKLLTGTVVGGTMAAGSAQAAIDMSGVATDITTDIGTAIPIGLAIMGLTFGLVVVKKAFKTAAR